MLERIKIQICLNTDGTKMIIKLMNIDIVVNFALE